VPDGHAGHRGPPDHRHDDEPHFCEVFFTDVRVPVENLVGVEGAAFKQTMRQLEHERGGIDRLVSNHALYRMAVERADATTR
jgi:alkylation response protein AidB-like acyl-CoA dehydrogenase